MQFLFRNVWIEIKVKKYSQDNIFVSEKNLTIYLKIFIIYKS